MKIKIKKKCILSSLHYLSKKKNKNQQTKNARTCAKWNPQPKSIVFSNLQH